MRYFYAAILVIFATLAMYYATRILYTKDKSQVVRLFTLTSIGSALWSGGYALMFPFDYRSIFMAGRAVGILGLFIFLLSGQALILTIGKKLSHTRAIICAECIVGGLVFVLVANPNSVMLKYTRYGIITAFKSSLVSIIYTSYTVLVALGFIIFSALMVSPKQPKKIRLFGMNFLGVEGLIICGLIIDTILPAFGINFNIPACTIFQFFGLMIIYRAVHMIARNNINVSNLTGYIYDSLKTPLLVFDEYDNLKIANEEARKVFDLGDNDNFWGVEFWKDIFGIKPPKNLNKESETRSIDATYLKKNYFFRLYVDPIFDDYNDYIGYIVSASDVTLFVQYTKKLQQSELEALKANQAKSEFLANMSHEIRTPMNAIIGFSEMALSENIEAKIRDYFIDIHDSAENLLDIINNILDISKIEAGKIEIVESEYTRDKLFKDISNIISVNAERKELKFFMDIDPEIPTTLIGDSTKVRQILINVLNNGIKYTLTGHVKLKAKLQSKTADECVIEYKIIDSGIGIKPEDLEKIFGNFSRVDAKLNKNTEGTGLGLSISKGFVELMGGTIEVESSYGNGSTFTITIPQRYVDEDEDSHEVSAEALQHKAKEIMQLKDVKILAVDDNAINLKVVVMRMKKMGVDIDTASSGKEAIDACINNSYDLIFMDQMMPEMDGVVAMKKIRSIGNEYLPGASCKIIALTANVVGDAKKELLSAGFDGFIGKPISTQELEELLRKILPRDKIVE